MADDDPKPVAKPKEVKVEVSIPQHLRAAVYANFINMDTSDNEITLDFIYVNKHDTPNGTLVSRIILPLAMLDKLTDGFVQVLELKGRKSR